MKLKELNHGTQAVSAGRGNCKRCKKQIPTRGATKFCSRECYWKDKIGTHQSREHSQKISDALKGKKKSAEHIRKVVEAHIGKKVPNRSGKFHFAWKGAKAKKGTIHDWMYNNYGSPQKCSLCGTTENRQYHWANKSQKYLRDINDWMRLCVPCHSNYDRRHPDSGYNCRTRKTNCENETRLYHQEGAQGENPSS